MSSKSLTDLMSNNMEKIKEMVDTDTIVGKPIIVDNTTIIPISKVTYGFGSGGGDIESKTQSEKELFGGGSGAGISVVPVAFLHVKNGDLKVTQVEPYFSSVDRVIELAPDIIERIKNLFKKDKENSEESVEDIDKK